LHESLTRQSERTETDPLGTDAVRNVARAIMRAVGDPKMHHSIPTKVARAVVDRKIGPGELAEVCDIIEAKRKAGQLEKPGAYFLVSMKRLFQRNEVPW
jgi:hypothetical protein